MATRRNHHPHTFDRTDLQWLDHWDDTHLRNRYGTTTLQRAHSYTNLNKVTDLWTDGHTTIGALVTGNRPEPYETHIRQHASPTTTWLTCTCTCPLRKDCKHTLATIITARNTRTRPGNENINLGRTTTPEWEQLLHPLTTTNHTPAALRFTQARPTYKRFGATTPTITPDITIRPMKKGPSGRWVKTGITWENLDNHRNTLIPAHYNALMAIRRLRLTNRYSYQNIPDELPLATLGENIWPALTAATNAGINLIGHELPTPHILTTPATVHMHATPTPPTTYPWLIGTSPHGMALWTDTQLFLAPLTQQLTPTIGQLAAGPLPIRIPATDIPRFTTHFLPALRQHITLTTDTTINLPHTEHPTLHIHARFTTNHRVTLTTTITYGNTPATTYPHCDTTAEQHLINTIPTTKTPPGFITNTAGHPAIAPTQSYSGPDLITVATQLLPTLTTLPNIHITTEGNPPEYQPTPTTPTIEFRIDDHLGTTTNPTRGDQRLKHTDWFNLGITVRVENHTITFTELFRALATGETHMMLPNGAWFPLDLPELTQLRTLIDESRHLIDPDRTTLHITPAHIGLYEHLTALGIITHEATTWRERINTLTTTQPTPPPPATLHANLRPYQIHGYTWMRRLWNAKLGGILADDMGLGKTLQVLAVAAAAHDNGELNHNPLLVIAPTSVVNTWLHEAATFAPDLRITTLTSTTGKSKRTITDRIAGAHLVITTYTIARIDDKEFAQIPWSGMILDEAHVAKNHHSKTYSALRHIKAPIRFAITGTPVENSLMGLWALLSITSPGLLPDPATFTDTYRRPIEEGTDPTRAEHLLKRIGPMLLRRTKEDVAADLPPKQEQTVRVALAPAHRRAYDTRLARERRRVLKLSEDLARNKVAIFSSLTMLRQLALAPALVAPDDPAMTSISSTKIDVLVDLLREVIDGGHRALVFSQFTRYLHMVQTRLHDEKITTTYLDGATRNRAAVIEEFRESDAPVFLISLKAGGVGLTLTEADYVFLMDPWWNPAAEQQAIDRTHRIGQHRQVMVYRLVATDTIEDKVIALGEHKRHIADTILNDPASLGGALTAEDLRNLLD